VTLPTVDSARTLMLEAATPLPVKRVPLRQAAGRWLAEPVLAGRDQPPFDASAMDGWAVRSADVAPGARLRIVGESAAGHAPRCVIGPGQAARIFTGAALPPGADRVVIQEEAESDGEFVVLSSVIRDGTCVRPRGGDFRRGEVLLAAGVRLDRWRLALAASTGTRDVVCGGRPRVAILATGDELVEPGQPVAPHQIYDSCTPALAAFVASQGGAPEPLPIARDDQDAIAALVSSAAFDVLVTVGGASVGDHDRVKPALRGLGAVLSVEGVAVRPGKPVWFARLADGRLVLGLPGNPASALVCAELFLGPLLRALQHGEAGPDMVTARLADPLPVNGPRDHYMRARLRIADDGVLWATPFPNQDSSLVGVMAAADALIRRPPLAPAAPVGAPVQVLRPAP